jgi:2,5-dihydroxypyridine 5,6-dioxygenase
MLQEILEPVWADAFEQVLRRCALQPGDTVAILCETQSRPVLAQLARLAAARIGAQVFTVTLQSLSGAGPSQGAKAPSGGSAVHEVTSVGVIYA